MFRTNAMCHAFGDDVANRKAILRIGAAVEIFDEQLVARVRDTRERRRAASRTALGDTAGSPCPNRRRLRDDGSLTTNLSFGDRPVCGDVTATERPHVGELAFVRGARRPGSAPARRDSSEPRPPGSSPCVSRPTLLCRPASSLRASSSRHVSHSLEKIVGVGPFVGRTRARPPVKSAPARP